MIPKFTSQTDLIGFIRALPSDANYGKMLADDFNVNVPENAEQFQKEFLWKYAVEGQYVKGLKGPELLQYAAEKTIKFGKEFPWKTQPIQPVTDGNVLPKTSKAGTTGRTRIVKGAQPDFTVLFLEHRQIWVGYFNGKIQCSKKTEQAAQEYLQKKFG